jgi:hypothetical protein
VGRPVTPLRLSANERVALERWARPPETAQALALRGTAGAKLRTGHSRSRGNWGPRSRPCANGAGVSCARGSTGCSMIRAPAARARLAEQVELVVRLTLESRPRDATQLR